MNEIVCEGQENECWSDEFVRSLLEYVDHTGDTAVFPGAGTQEGLTYTTLGLIGELGEVAEHAKKSLRDDNGTFTDERRAKMSKEVGDFMWYWSETSRAAGLNVLRTIKLSPTNRPGSRDVSECIRRLSWNVAEVCKSLSDEYRSPVRDTTSVIENWLAMSLMEVVWVCNGAGIDFTAILQANLEKLKSRKERGVLQGSCSDR